MTYQDVLDADGRVLQPGTRECAERFDAIASRILEADLDGSTMLDLGAYAGYFAQRAAQELGCKVTAVDDWRGLAGLVVDGVTVINRRLSPEEVADLGRFDVVLALSVLHHIPEWRSMLDVLRANSTLLFVEPPNADEVLPKAVSHGDPIAEVIAGLGGEVIATTPGHRSDIPRELWVMS